MTTPPAPSDPVLRAPKKPRSRLARSLAIARTEVPGCAVLSVAACVFVFGGAGGEPADRQTSERNAKAVVTALAGNQPELARHAGDRSPGAHQPQRYSLAGRDPRSGRIQRPANFNSSLGRRGNN